MHKYANESIIFFYYNAYETDIYTSLGIVIQKNVQMNLHEHLI